MGVIYRNNSGEKHFRPIIFHPFDIGLTLSLEELKNWTKEYLIVRMGYLTSILVVILDHYRTNSNIQRIRKRTMFQKSISKFTDKVSFFRNIA